MENCYWLHAFGHHMFILSFRSLILTHHLPFSFYCNSLFYSKALLAMALNWITPPPRTFKINVHSTSFEAPMPNGNTNGIGVVLRTSNGNLVNRIAVTIPHLTLLDAQLWAIQVGLRRGFVKGATDIILETDNLQAYGVVQYAHLHQHPELDDLIHQITPRIRDPNWTCRFRFVYPDRNRSATYVSLLGGELFCVLYIFFEPIGRIAEIMDLDMGLGPQAPQFLEAHMVEEELNAFEEIMADGGGALAENFLVNNIRLFPSLLLNGQHIHALLEPKNCG